ncbi:alpha/beta hydrolase [Actinoplanes sp. OR16]|uniref:alpha/beta hydrolase n=1 Tax=Actinoplanes sp. OR16 TaxID=946334 RepID=UPI000F719674|nr:alpha/beta hydrolase [Actinoplanes sp. OR16]BBH68493.1 alpha/beta hydrolase [Actinoplanes sp. OR16]
MRRVRHPLLAIVLTVTAALAASPAAAALPPPARLAASVPPSAAPAPAPGEYRGTLASGATWLGHIPERWNGTVLLFAHGFGALRAQDAPNDQVRDLLLAEGYATVGSSYSGPTLWALESALDDQSAALAAFTDVLGHEPRRTIAIGQSMGGLVSARQAHQPRGVIDGALTTCGIVAGGLNLNNYQLDGLHALTELLAPGRDIPLVRYTSPEQAAQAAADITALVVDAQTTPAGRARIALAAAFFNLTGWVRGETRPAPRDYIAQQEHQYRILTSGALNRYVTARQQIELSAGGNSAFNKDVDYRALLASSAQSVQVTALYRTAGLDLRADLKRLTGTADITADPWAVTDLSRSSMPNGSLRVPHLEIHTIADELVPVEQVDWYAEHARYHPDRFRSLFVNTSGHCAFLPSEYLTALHALERRIRTGHWPSLRPADLSEAGADYPGGQPRFIRFTPTRLVGGLAEPGR